LEENQDSDKDDITLKEIVPLRVGKPQGRIVQIKEEKEALELLIQMGRSVFPGRKAGKVRPRKPEIPFPT
jgi:hypothetical protein